jgi:hypothetical protein
MPPLLSASSALLGNWFVTLSLLSAFVTCLPLFTEFLALCPTPFSKAGSGFHPNPTVGVDYNSLFMLLSFVQ